MCGPRASWVSRRTALLGALGTSVAAGFGRGAEALAAPRPDGPTVIVGATVFDGRSSLGPATVVVNDARIAAVGPRVSVPSECDVVDGRGKTLLPGLIDAHVHAFGLSNDPVRFGVTTELDMFTFLETLGPYREQRASTAPTEFSDLWSAGTLLTAPGGHGTQYGPIPTLGPDAGEAAVDEFVRARLSEGSDYVKVIIEDGSLYGDGQDIPTLTSQQVKFAVDAAHDSGATSVVHVARERDAGLAFTAGADGLAHVPGEPISDEVLDVAAASGGFVTATLSVFNGMSCAGEARRVLEDPLIAPWLSQEQRDTLQTGEFCLPEIYPTARDNVRALHEAGVTILAGTDVPNPGTARGASLLSELGLLVDAGLSPVDALHAATGAPADRFGLGDRGGISPGLRADLVLVDGDATQDIDAVRAVNTIWRNGRRITRRV